MDMFDERMMMTGWKCVTLVVEGARQRARPTKTWKEVVDNDI